MIHLRRTNGGYIHDETKMRVTLVGDDWMVHEGDPEEGVACATLAEAREAIEQFAYEISKRSDKRSADGERRDI